MGEVYRARDLRLDRFVAVKVLPGDVAGDRTRLARFEREAKAASALNHPHIVNIYETGESDHGRYIAMELVEGQTLRAAAGGKDPRRLLPALINVADALAAAHAAGIVHRDLKPENILITADGYAKVVDFGLAKLTQADTSDSNSPTQEWMKTGDGVVVGTVGYMSPEQVEGLQVDHRSDIFSLGCVLYEVINGRRPFEGRSAVDTMHKIVHEEPPPISAEGSVPPDVQRVVRRCLAKNPEERYQSIKEVAIELREITRSIPSGTSTRIAPPRRRRLWWVAMAPLVVIIAALAFWRTSARRAGGAFSLINMKRLTATGTAREAAISPDGKYVAYVVADGGKEHIRLMQLATGSDLQILEGDQTPLGSLRFSPDGAYLYFDRNANDVHTLYRTAILGGESRRIVVDCDSPPSFSPDGLRMVFLRYDPSSRTSLVITATPEGAEEHVVVRRHGPTSLLNPVWSAAGEIVTVARDGNGRYTVVAIDPSNAKERTIADGGWSFVNRVSDGGNGQLLVTAEKDGALQLWLVALNNGEVRRLSNDVNDYGTASATTSGDAVAAVQTRTLAGICKVALGSAAPPIDITPTAEARDGTLGIAWRADGGLVFTSSRRGATEIWASSADGKDVKPLTDATGYFPCAFGSGTRVVYTTVAGGGPLAVVDDVNHPQLLPVRGNTPACSPVDDAVIVPKGNGLALFHLSSPDTSRQVMNTRAIWPAFSPDGTRVASLVATDQGWVGTVVPIAGGAPRRYPQITSEPDSLTGVRWTADGEALLFKKKIGNAANIWRQPIDGATPEQVTHFRDGEIFDFSISRDGKWLALSRGSISSDVVLITRH
jgi:Tol biopolymer transport system component